VTPWPTSVIDQPTAGPHEHIAAGGAGGIEHGRAGREVVVIAVHRDRAGLAIGVADVDRAGLIDRTGVDFDRFGGVGRTGKFDLPAFAGDGDVVGIDVAGLPGGEGVHIAGAHRDSPARRVDAAGILDGGFGRLIGRAAFEFHHDVVVVARKVDRFPGGHGDEPIGRDDRAVVGHVLADQRDELAVDRTLIHDRAVDVGEPVDAVDEVGIGDVARGGGDRADVHNGLTAEVHAGRVDDIHPAVGGQLAVDAGDVAVHHAVEHARLRVGLDESHGFVAGDVERLVIDDRAVGGGDVGHVALRVDIDVAVHDVRALWAGQGRGDDVEHQRADAPADDVRTIEAMSVAVHCDFNSRDHPASPDGRAALRRRFKQRLTTV